MADTHIIIMAGGKGTRMKSENPKVLTMLGGRPMIVYPLAEIVKICARPTIIVGYKGEEVVKTLGDNFHYAWQREQLGTGHAVMCAKNDLSKEDIKTIVVFNGDHPLIKAGTIAALIESHKKSGVVLSIGTVKVPAFTGDFAGFYNYGRIIRDGNGNISKITEVKDASEAEREITEVNVNCYCFEASWLWDNIESLKNENKAGEYLLTDTIGIAVSQGHKINAYILDDPYAGYGINTQEELARAEEIIKNK
jgi:bifunctional UDP-N-acetylglucosamine pyrophosphorylase/glucosamine-1-phosphate N-acetyltransferase